MATSVLVTLRPTGDGGDYDDALSAFVAEARSLTAADEICIVEAQGDWSADADTSGEVFLSNGAGWATDSTRYIVFRADAANWFDGIYDVDKYYHQSSGKNMPSQQETRVEGIQFVSTGTSTNGGNYNYASQGTGKTHRLDSCLFRGGYGHNVRAQVATRLKNCVLDGAGVNNLAILSGQTVYSHNCTFRDSTSDGINNAGTLNLKNALIQNSGSASVANTGTLNESYNCTDDGVLAGTGDVTETVAFVGADDHNISSATTAVTAGGTDLSADATLPVTVDCAGVTRSSTPTMGALEVAGGGDPVSATYAMTFESLGGIVSTNALPAESLGGVVATATPSAEALASVALSASAPVESLGGVQLVTAGHIEALASVVGSVAAGLESTLPVALVATGLIESLLGVVASSAASVEATAGVSATSAVHAESLGGVAATSAAGAESLAAVTTSSQHSVEALQGIAATVVPVLESLAGVVLISVLPLEALGEGNEDVSATYAFPIEALGSVALTSATAIESLASLVAESTGGIESTAQVRLESQQAIEALGGVSSPVALPLEAMAEVRALAGTAAFESLLGVGAALVVPLESLAGVVAVVPLPLEALSESFEVSVVYAFPIEALAGVLETTVAHIETTGPFFVRSGDNRLMSRISDRSVKSTTMDRPIKSRTLN